MLACMASYCTVHMLACLDQAVEVVMAACRVLEAAGAMRPNYVSGLTAPKRPSHGYAPGPACMGMTPAQAQPLLLCQCCSDSAVHHALAGHAIPAQGRPTVNVKPPCLAR